MLRRKSGLRLRQRRCPRRRDWLRLFTCSWTWGGGRRGGPLNKNNNDESTLTQVYKHFQSKVEKNSNVDSCQGPIWVTFPSRDWGISFANAINQQVTWCMRSFLLRIQTGKLRQKQAVALCDGLFCGGCCQVALESQDLLFLSLGDLQLPVDHLRLCVLIRNGAWREGVVTVAARRDAC